MTNFNLTAPNTLQVSAYFDGYARALGREVTPDLVTFEARVATREEAEALVAHFPKSYAFGISSVSALTDEGWKDGAYFTVRSRANLSPRQGNTKNETGIKRYHAIQAKAAKAGIAVEWTVPFGASYETREAFEAAL